MPKMSDLSIKFREIKKIKFKIISALANHIFKNIYLKLRFIFLSSQLIDDEIILSHIALILSLVYRTKSVR